MAAALSDPLVWAIVVIMALWTWDHFGGRKR
jgi:hypothetical protein